jgi:hypothetical protein
LTRVGDLGTVIIPVSDAIFIEVRGDLTSVCHPSRRGITPDHRCAYRGLSDERREEYDIGINRIDTPLRASREYPDHLLADIEGGTAAVTLTGAIISYPLI